MKVKVTLTCKHLPNLGTYVWLLPEPDNEWDNEAIAVYIEPDHVKDGYVAAYYKIRQREHWSAGRLLDRIPSTGQFATVTGSMEAELDIPEMEVIHEDC